MILKNVMPNYGWTPIPRFHVSIFAVTTISSSALISSLAAGLGIHSLVIARFLRRNEQFAQKNEQFAHCLIFGERPEQISHGRSFLVSDLSDSLTLLIFVSDLND